MRTMFGATARRQRPALGKKKGEWVPTFGIRKTVHRVVHSSEKKVRLLPGGGIRSSGKRGQTLSGEPTEVVIHGHWQFLFVGGWGGAQAVALGPS